jgi:hypothetical protein
MLTRLFLPSFALGVLLPGARFARIHCAILFDRGI